MIADCETCERKNVPCKSCTESQRAICFICQGDIADPYCELEDEMGQVTESIYSGSVVVALADVQHCEMHPKNTIPGMHIITSHTKWNFARDLWENSIWLNEPEATKFRSAWCRYRSELEADTLANLEPHRSHKVTATPEEK